MIKKMKGYMIIVSMSPHTSSTSRSWEGEEDEEDEEVMVLTRP
jgi:hypothetical protein